MKQIFTKESFSFNEINCMPEKHMCVISVKINELNDVCWNITHIYILNP